ncbi:MAG: sigma-70 family RNA polymerase sigma factor [Acutalibacter sp.]|nr:sigma-70 family RNA polymerase sigma factor [Acutalibacter sp.]
MGKTEKLVRKAQQGNKDAFVQLMEESKLSMSRTALAILHREEDAADAIAETVLTAFTKLCGLRNPQYFKTWLTRILIYNCYGILQQQKRTIPLEELPETAWKADRMGDYDNVIDIQASFRELAENDRLILTLFYMEDLSVKEIAQLLHIRENAVKTRLNRSRNRFRKVYEEREESQHEVCSG